MKYDNENIEISQRLKFKTISAAGVALSKKRFRIITASSAAAVAIAVFTVFFALGAEPRPDVVLDGTSASQGPLQTESIEAMNFDYLSLAKAYLLSHTGEIGEKTLEFDEEPPYAAKLDVENILEWLAEYGYSAEIPRDGIPKGYIYYIAVFKAGAIGLRYVDLPLKIINGEIVFQCTCLDSGPFTVENYPGLRPTLSAETGISFLIALPPAMENYGLTAEYINWADLSEEIKVSTVIDTIMKHGDMNEILAAGVSSSLSFELAVLNDYLETSVDYLRGLNNTFAYDTAEGGESSVMRFMLYHMLNLYQLKTYDTDDPLQTVEKELLSYELAEPQSVSDSLIIPETHVYDISQNENSAELVLYSAIYTFNPPLPPTYKYRAVRAYLDKSEDGSWEVNLIYLAETPDEVFRHMEEYSGEIFNVDNTFIKSEMLINAIERHNMLTGENITTDMQEEYLTNDLSMIKTYLYSRYGQINSTYPAVARDLANYMLDKNAKDGMLQVTSVYPLSEDFDNPITVAVLAATYDGSGSERQVPKLYVVKAYYDESHWALTGIASEEKKTLSMDEFPKLQYRGFYEVYEVLFSELINEVKELNAAFNVILPLPAREETDLSGGYLDLGFQSGISRFINVSRFIRPEEDYGCMIPLWYSEDEPADLSYTAFAQAVKNADWKEIDENDQGRPYSKTELGFIGFSVNIDLQNANGLYQFRYTFDTLKNKALLTVSKRGEKTRYYEAGGSELCGSGIETFNIETDVSEYMITEEKGPSLPYYREELKYLTSIVGDMPGGIVSITAVVGEEFSVSEVKDAVINNEDDIIDWAQAVGETVSQYSLKEIRQTPVMGAPSVVWDIELAAQEGVGKLQIIGYADTGAVYIRKTYRLYGKSEAHEQYYTAETPELFDLLCEFSFGRSLR